MDDSTITDIKIKGFEEEEVFRSFYFPMPKSPTK